MSSSPNLGAWRWSSPSTSGKPPSPRAGYASAVFGGTLFVVGGWDGTKAFNDAFALDLETFRWRQLFLRGEGDDDKPPLEGRILFGHAGIGKTIYIHGGAQVSNLATLHDDVLALDTASGSISRLATSGRAPGLLMRHSIAARGAALWVVGGFDGKSFSSDVHRLDFGEDGAEAVWHRVEAEGFTPWPRALGCLVALDSPSSHLILAGGGDGDRDFDDAVRSRATRAPTATDPIATAPTATALIPHPPHRQCLLRMGVASSDACPHDAYAKVAAALRLRPQYALDVEARPAPYWVRLTNITGEAWALSNAACALLPLQAAGGAAAGSSADSKPHGTGVALVMHGGFGGPVANMSAHERQHATRVLPLGSRGADRVEQQWRWFELKTSGALPPPRMSHRIHVVNATCIVTFGGNSDGKHLADVSVGVPNRLARAPAAGAAMQESDSQAQASNAAPSTGAHAGTSTDVTMDVTPDAVLRTVPTGRRGAPGRRAQDYAPRRGNKQGKRSRKRAALRRDEL